MDLLIKRCQAGSKNDMEELVKRYYYPLRSFFLKHELSLELSEDLTHDTVIKMIENIEKYHNIPGSKFSTWLFTIAYNTLLNYFKKYSTKNELGILEDNELSLYSYDSTEDEAIINITKAELEDKVNSLPIQDKILINLRYGSDFNYKEISKIIDTDEKPVKWKLHNAIERLKKLYKKKGDEKNELPQFKNKNA